MAAIICKVCGKEFKDRPCRKRKYCSIDCRIKSLEWIKLLRISHTGKHYSTKTEFKKGQASWNKGKKCYQFAGENNGMFGKKRPDNIIRNKKMKELGLLKLENNPNWKGGKSYEVYGFEFTKKLKEKIRNLFNRKCAECGYSEEQLGYKLSIHHIDYNKKNNKEDNLIPLCVSCHTQTNFNRDDWVKYFRKELYGCNC